MNHPITRLRRDYAILGCKGAEDALLAMAPERGAPKEAEEDVPALAGVN